MKQERDTAQRKPDCVTEIRVGNTILTVSGFFKLDATETAVDKMEKVVAARGAATTFTETDKINVYARSCAGAGLRNREACGQESTAR